MSSTVTESVHGVFVWDGTLFLRTCSLNNFFTKVLCGHSLLLSTYPLPFPGKVRFRVRIGLGCPPRDLMFNTRFPRGPFPSTRTVRNQKPDTSPPTLPPLTFEVRETRDTVHLFRRGHRVSVRRYVSPSTQYFWVWSVFAFPSSILIPPYTRVVVIFRSSLYSPHLTS